MQGLQRATGYLLWAPLAEPRAPAGGPGRDSPNQRWELCDCATVQLPGPQRHRHAGAQISRPWQAHRDSIWESQRPGVHGGGGAGGRTKGQGLGCQQDVPPTLGAPAGAPALRPLEAPPASWSRPAGVSGASVGVGLLVLCLTERRAPRGFRCPLPWRLEGKARPLLLRQSPAWASAPPVPSKAAPASSGHSSRAGRGRLEVGTLGGGVRSDGPTPEAAPQARMNSALRALPSPGDLPASNDRHCWETELPLCWETVRGPRGPGTCLWPSRPADQTLPSQTRRPHTRPPQAPGSEARPRGRAGWPWTRSQLAGGHGSLRRQRRSSRKRRSGSGPPCLWLGQRRRLR